MDESLYDSFPKEIVEEEAVALQFVTSGGEISHVPNSVFGSRNFCIEILKLSSKNILKVPNFFFEDKVFLMKLFNEYNF